jgi:hypothetical protein
MIQMNASNQLVERFVGRNTEPDDAAGLPEAALLRIRREILRKLLRRLRAEAIPDVNRSGGCRREC